MKTKSTQELILESGKRIFLEKGFKNAPLRRIVREAGYTLGAFYGYYSTKEDLFCAIIAETAEGFKALMESLSEEVYKRPPDSMIFDIMECYLEKLPNIADYIYLHKDEMILLIKCSEGTRYENFFDSFRKNNKELIKEGLKKAKASGITIRGLEADTFELLMRSHSEAMLKIMVEGSDKEQILRMMRDVGAVFRNGMLSLMEDK